MRSCWDKHAREWVPADEYYARRRRPAGPQVITDTIDGFQSQADGKMYDSKSAYRRTLREQGYVEVGNERLPTRRGGEPTGISDDIRRAIAEHS